MILLHYYFPFPVRRTLNGGLSLLMTFVVGMRKEDPFPRATVSMEIKYPGFVISRQ